MKSSSKTSLKIKSQKKDAIDLGRKSYVQELIRLFLRYYPDPKCALEHETPAQLLFATILSAQCTDERVNQVTKVLFKKYPSVVALAAAKISELEEVIRSTGFFKNKAKNLKECARALVKNHNAEVPQTLEELTALAGVGRKTANVVLGNAFLIPSGIVVDTHVTRLSRRLGLTQSENAEVIERELIPLVDKKYWISFSHWLIIHGRNTCKARKPACDICFLQDLCPKKL